MTRRSRVAIATDTAADECGGSRMAAGGQTVLTYAAGERTDGSGALTLR
jgi:hypothetical protein